MFASLHLVATTFESNVRDALVHYEILAQRHRPGRPQNGPNLNRDSGYIYNFTSSCSGITKEIDRYAGALIERDRSYETSSSSALKFIADNVPIDYNRRVSIVTITDSFSSSRNRISEIRTNIAKIKDKVRSPVTGNTNARFFSIGIKAQHTGRGDDLVEELLALADSDRSRSLYITYDDFIDTLLNLLVEASILCPSQS